MHTDPTPTPPPAPRRESRPERRARLDASVARFVEWADARRSEIQRAILNTQRRE